MFLINDLPTADQQKVRTACAYLFSPDHARNNEFVQNLQLRPIENAFIQKEKRYNPYLYENEPQEIIKKRVERLFKIKESYNLLKSYFIKDTTSEPTPVKYMPNIIAVGGAKGGTGKSLFAANLGISLSTKGKRTVLIDLDLGCSDLHYYLGLTSLKYSVNDYLNKKIPSLNMAAVSTDYGPRLIGGGSSQLGSANIHFSRKLKLLRAIKEIDAEYIIIDLGGDTSYNSIDFFLAADSGIVVTTCDPTSYISAYSFIKVSLQRKFCRIFGAESKYRKQADQDLKQLIDETVLSSNNNGENFIKRLTERIKIEKPGYESFIADVLKSFHPHIIVNMIDEGTNVPEVTNPIQEVAKKLLSIQIGYLGSIPYQQEIKNSVKELVPPFAKYPDGAFSASIHNIFNKLQPHTSISPT